MSLHDAILNQAIEFDFHNCNPHITLNKWLIQLNAIIPRIKRNVIRIYDSQASLSVIYSADNTIISPHTHSKQKQLSIGEA